MSVVKKTILMRTTLSFLLCLVASHPDCLMSFPAVVMKQLEGSEPATEVSRSFPPAFCRARHLGICLDFPITKSQSHKQDLGMKYWSVFGKQGSIKPPGTFTRFALRTSKGSLRTMPTWSLWSCAIAVGKSEPPACCRKAMGAPHQCSPLLPPFTPARCLSRLDSPARRAVRLQAGTLYLGCTSCCQKALESVQPPHELPSPRITTAPMTQPGGQYVAPRFWEANKGLDWLPASAAAHQLCWCVEYLAGGIPHSESTNALARSPSIYQNQAGAAARPSSMGEPQAPASVEGQPWAGLGGG